MAKLGKTNLPQTDSDFMVVGKLVGTNKDKFYTQSTTQTGKSQRTLKFGVEFEKGKTVYVTMKGMEQANVYFYRKADDKKNIKSETRAIPWDKRQAFKEHGFTVIGTKYKLDQNQEYATTSTEYDACAEVAVKLKELGDGTQIRVTGKINRFTMNSKNGEVINATQFIVQQIFLSSAEEDGLKNHYFHEQLVVTGVDSVTEEHGVDTHFVIEGYTCTYNTLEPVSFFTSNNKLINTFKRLLNKGYFAVKVYGDIRVEQEEETVVVEPMDDEWGEADATVQSTGGFTTYDLWVRGAEQESLDHDTYTKQNIEKAIELTKKDEVASADYGTTTDELILESEDEVDMDDWA